MTIVFISTQWLVVVTKVTKMAVIDYVPRIIQSITIYNQTAQVEQIVGHVQNYPTSMSPVLCRVVRGGDVM